MNQERANVAEGPAFEKLWSDYRAGIEALVRSRVSNPADVDDLIQDILMRTYKNLKTVQSEERIKSWLFQISKNAIIDHYRKKGRAEDCAPPIEVDEDEDSEGVQEVLAQCIRPFMSTLPKDAQALLMAIDIEGQSQKEYAEKHGLKYSTLKSQVQKSRAQLRAAFERCCRFSRDGRGQVSDFEPKSGQCGNC